MIRINLLPVRQSKKKEMGKQLLVLFAAVIVLAGVLNFLYYSSRQSEHDRNQDQIVKIQKRIEELKSLIGEVENINKREKELKDKLKILDELERGRGGPVKLMDALAQAIPEKVWLNSFEEAGGGIKIVGTAASNEDVAHFMRGLNAVVYSKQKGMGRIIEHKRATKTVRVELIDGAGGVDELPADEAAPFFNNVELKTVRRVGAGGAQGTASVTFELSLRGNYAI